MSSWPLFLCWLSLLAPTLCPFISGFYYLVLFYSFRILYFLTSSSAYSFITFSINCYKDSHSISILLISSWSLCRRVRVSFLSSIYLLMTPLPPPLHLLLMPLLDLMPTSALAPTLVHVVLHFLFRLHVLLSFTAELLTFVSILASIFPSLLSSPCSYSYSLFSLSLSMTMYLVGCFSCLLKPHCYSDTKYYSNSLILLLNYYYLLPSYLLGMLDQTFSNP